MIGLALVLQVAASSAARTVTVGDTIWVARTVRVAPHQTVHPLDWTPPDPIEVVGPPRVTAHDSVVEIAYPLTVWRAGTQRVAIPGPLLLAANGSADSLPAEAVTLDVASVLPKAPADSLIKPQPRVGVVPLRTTSILPLIILIVLAVLLVAPAWVLWRRRGKPVPRGPRGAADAAIPVERWADAGERRAVASLAAARLRGALARRNGDVAPSVAFEVEELLGALDRTRFGSTADGDAMALFRRAVALEVRIAGQGA